jgi:hypothetical protein
METIVAGRFETFEQAETAVRHLVAEGFHREDASAFFVNPPGQHAQFPIGGDQYADADAGAAGPGAVAGAVAGGAAGLAAAMAVPGLNVAILLGVIGVGAYTGSLAGTLAKLGARKPPDVRKPMEESEASPGRPAGVLVAVRVLSDGAEDVAVEILRQEGAVDIEHAKGVWQDGEWKDFDPVAPIQLVDEGTS